MNFNMMELIDKYTITYFENALIKKLDVTTPSHSLNGWIRSYQKALEVFDFQNAQAICYNLLRLQTEIEAIEKYDNLIFLSLKRIIQQDNNYAGARFETTICYRLIKAEIPFRIGNTSKGESDFYLQKNGEDDLIFECTTFNISTPRNAEDAFQKFIRKLSDKKFKSYVSNKTILLIDVTNIIHFFIPLLKKENIEQDDLSRIFINMTEKGLEGSQYGGAFLSLNHFDKNTLSYNTSWKRLYFDGLDYKHQEILNQIFPVFNNTKKVFFTENLFPKHA